MLIALFVIGDYQFDVYRMMKEYNEGKWQPFNPFTNVMVSQLHVFIHLVSNSGVITVVALPPNQTYAIEETEAASSTQR
jgi:hypothetical protein